MKVKLATQLHGRSVATALNFCKNILNLEDFQNSGATIKFLNLFNDAFGILNSRSLIGFGYKKALCSKNDQQIVEFIKTFSLYVKSLKFLYGQLVIDSNRKTGFLGFLICFESLLQPIIFS